MLKTYVAAKAKIAELKDRLVQDNSGAALIEYSILIGLITVAAIAAIIVVGGWVANQWGNLETALGV
jgi:pilus assembly protein Flp/PilA